MRSVIAKGDIQVPAQNSADNNYINDVIGNKTDDESGDSQYSLLYITEKHTHAIGEVYPDFSISTSGVQVTSSATAGAHGTITQIIPAATVDVLFDVHWINVLAASANATYELKLYWGVSDTLTTTIQFVKSAVMDAAKEHQCMTIKIPAGSKVSASLASDNAVADTANISLQYHRY